MSAHAGGGADGLRRAAARLTRLYDTRDWWPARSRFEVLAGAVLVQNTRWANVERALGALRAARLLQPAALAGLSPARLTRLIRPAGCQQVKSRRLQAVSAGVEAAGGLARLARLSTPELRDQLLAWHGIGEETADAVLLFAFDRPVFVADSYARRWLARMGLFDAGVGQAAYRRCKQYAEAHLPRSAVQHRQLHAAIVLHAQAQCRRTPDCDSCKLNNSCLFNS